MEETLRINGRARLTTEADVLEATAIDGRLPKVAVVVDVDLEAGYQKTLWERGGA